MRQLLAAAVVAFTALTAQAQDKKVDKKAEKVAPTIANLSYGKHPRQVLDFWKAKSETPTPLVIYIHGGGWRAGDKDTHSQADLKRFLDAGVSVAAINYRFVKHGEEDMVEPPVKAPLHDAMRALQTIRSKSAEWNLDKKRVGATGGSAGACTSLWLAFHDDMADPKSDDPITRESTRLSCAAVNGAQVSLDPVELKQWIPNYTYGAHAFGMKDLNEVAAKRESIMKWIKEYSPIEHLSKDDPPILLNYYKQATPPAVGAEQKDPTHSGVMGIKLQERCKMVGVECVLIHQDQTDPRYKGTTDFLIERLKK